MFFDYKEQLKAAYRESTCLFSFEEALSVFNCYFEKYREAMRREHPRLRTSKLIDILNGIDGDGMFSAENYKLMIEQYFDTKFGNCDRNICHFFSGKIRELRRYETCL